MVKMWKLPVFLLLAISASSLVDGAENEAAFYQWVYNDYLPELEKLMTADVQASWNYETNLTDSNEALSVAASAKTASYTQTMARVMESRFQNTVLSNDTNKRLHRKIGMIGDAKLSEEKFKQLVTLKNRMSQTYSTAVVCGIVNVLPADCPNDKKLSLEPGITQLLDDPNTPEDLLVWVWSQWRVESGKKMRADYLQYIELKNEAAQANGFNNSAEMWRNPYVEPEKGYTDQNFMDEVKVLYQQTRPLYEQVHAYVRGKILQKHGLLGSKPTGPIPAHLLGNMWAQTWLGTLNFTQLYPDREALDVTQAMKAQKWTPMKMFETSNNFFKDLGLVEMPSNFWPPASMIEKPNDRNVTCHASAWDFYDGNNFRIKQCTEVTMQDLFTVHHEMGHVEYFLQYKHQPATFKDGANDGFHEAIGDVLALSVSTPKHLKLINLLDQNTVIDDETNLNFQFSTALEKIAFLPFGLMLDMYRYDVFSGVIAPEQLNQKWWEYVTEYQGICAPSARRGEEFFDAGAKYHVPADVPYMRYFVSFIIQFQFHQALCKEAGHTGPLYECDINGNKKAGAKLGEALKLGSSRPWQDVMKIITGQEKMDAQPLMDFFQPLSEFLRKENARQNFPVGWTNDSFCPLTAFESYVKYDFNPKAESVAYASVEASWAYNTNITDANEKAMIAASGVSAEFDKEIADTVRAEYAAIATGGTVNEKRLYEKLTKLGDAGLDAAKFKELQEVGAKMSRTYSTARVCEDMSLPLDRCPEDKKMALESSPGRKSITEELANSRDHAYLKYLWKTWRDETGKKMRQDYVRYAELKNEAARKDGYADTAEAWRAPFVEPSKNFTDDIFMNNVTRLWEQLRPLYTELHAYVRHALIQKYPDANIDPKGPIPAHLLGNMWAQTWGAVQNFSQLYQKAPLDVTEAMKAQGYNATKMFQTSDKFFSDLGLYKMPQEFWAKSMLTKPEGREVTCHASAWDFYNRKDFRIKQCTAVTMDDFITVHHEMGHVEYYLQYKNLPVPYRRGANDGFHEAVGDVLSLSVSTPRHLQKIGLLSNETNINDKELDLNFMYSTALEKIAFLPFGLLMDLYRYDIFSGNVTAQNFNSKWWDYRVGYQGVCSPVERSENDFDPGAKYHIPADVPYMRYFVSFVIQFQFHKALCNAANHTGPLYQCDIDGSKAAGALLGNALRMGSSMPWQDAMKTITGYEYMDAGPLAEFFEPLKDELKKRNDANGVERGWKTDNHVCQAVVPPTTEPTTGVTGASNASSPLPTVQPQINTTASDPSSSALTVSLSTGLAFMLLVVSLVCSQRF